MPGTRRPPSHTSLAALPAIALDLETTGLDVANDRIVQTQEEQLYPVMEPALRDPMRYASSDPRGSYPIGTSGTHT